MICQTRSFTCSGTREPRSFSLVAKNFMHISLEPRFVTYIVVTALVFILLFFAAVAPDVMNPEGTQWQKPSWIGPPE